MVKKILLVLTKEISGLHQAAYLLGFFTFLSQLLGLVRDRLLAHMFGASSVLDIYYAAFRIPDLILAGAASIVSISILVPYLTERIHTSKESGKRFIDQIFSAFFVFIIVVGIIVFIGLPWIIPAVFPGFSGESLDQLILLTRILLLSPILLGLSNLFASIVQVHKKFFVYALSPILYNIGIIVGIVGLYPIFGIAGLGFGVALGALMHLGIQVPVVADRDFLPAFTLNIDFSALKEVVATSLPRALTLSANHVSILFLISLASVMAEGSIAVLNFSLNLQSVPLGIIGVSYSLAAFPTLSKLFTKGKREEFFRQVTTAARHILFWALPALVLFIVLRAQIVRTVLGTGQFGWEATRLTAAALALFSISVAAQSLWLLFVRGYYATGDTKKPLIVTAIGTVAIVVSSYGLVALFNQNDLFRFFVESLLRVEAVSGAHVLMLPLAYSIGMMINAGLLWVWFQKDFSAFSQGISRTLWQSLSASVIMGFVSYQALRLFAGVFDIQTAVGIFLQGASAGVVGILTAVGVLWVLKNEEIQEMIAAFKEKIWSVELIGPEQDEL